MSVGVIIQVQGSAVLTCSIYLLLMVSFVSLNSDMYSTSVNAVLCEISSSIGPIYDGIVLYYTVAPNTVMLNTLANRLCW